MSGFFSTTRTTTNTNYVVVNSEINIGWLTWADEPVKFSVNGSFYNSGAHDTICSIGVDGTSPLDVYVVNDGATAAPLCISTASSFSEGYHYSTILGRVSSDTGNWAGSGTVGLRTTHQAIVMG